LKSEALPARVALIEMDSSHDECLLTQINALKQRGCWILLITNEEVRARNQYLENLVDEWREIDPKGKKIRGAAIGDAMIIWRMVRSLKKQKIEKVIFNTGQGGHVRNACLFSLFSKMEFIGIIHTIRKFQGSFTQRVIGMKMKKYFVLADFLKEQVIPTPTSAPLSHRREANTKAAEQAVAKQQEMQTSVSSYQSHRNRMPKLQSFYPLDFPKEDFIPEKDDKLHISIIGAVESRRKDLEGFVSLVEQSDPSVHFHFLGKADPNDEDIIQLKEELEKISRLDQVEFFETRIEFTEMNQILRKSNAILPLVHPNTPSADEYFRHQIPGAMSMTLGYNIPLLLHQSVKHIGELQPASVYYSMSDFSEALTKLTSEENIIREVMEQSAEFSSAHQYKKYLNFIFD
jgi:hypothetical protein